MHYKIAVYLVVLIAFIQIKVCDKNKEIPMNNQLLAVKVECKENPECLFEDKDIFLNIIITNTQQETIGFPLEFAQDKGPTVKLVDTRTKKESYLSTHLADWALKDKFTWIKPGESVNMEWVVFSEELKQFGGPYVDVSIEVSLGEKVQMGDKLYDFIGTGVRQIVSKDKPNT